MKKSTALKELEQLAATAERERYPNMPARFLAPPRFTDKTANALTKSILAWLKLNNCHAERINTMGVPMDHRRVTTDCIGRKRQIGSITWRKSTSTKGSADIHSLIKGKAVYIEVKAGNDRMRPAQKEYKRQVEEAGGVYMIATSFEQFFKWYKIFCTAV